MKKLLVWAMLLMVGCLAVVSCSDDADQRRVYIENNTSDTLLLYLADGQLYSTVHSDFSTIFPKGAVVEMPFFVPINEIPSYPFDTKGEKVMFKTKNGGKVVTKNYHNAGSFTYGTRTDYEGYFFVVEESDLAN